MSDAAPPPDGPRGNETAGGGPNGDEPPKDLPELLRWLRIRYTERVYMDKGQLPPREFANGYTERMVARCLRAHGFRPCDQSRVSRMETGENWPGKTWTRRNEKGAFLRAAVICFGLQDNQHLRALLWVALLMKSGADGFPDSELAGASEVMQRFRERREQ